ncbi:hypothetical protein [Leptospira ellisii]|nr:hypothetical protein [Leptospira ellisii]PKA02540.1 hypothetical protein CH375_22430 [Leptospira ellisii]
MSYYLKVVSKAFQRSSAYRLEYYTGILNAALYLLILTSVWNSVPGNELSGTERTKDSLVLYAVFSTLIRVSF